jgi:hypothetical protein
MPPIAVETTFTPLFERMPRCCRVAPRRLSMFVPRNPLTVTIDIPRRV